MGMGLVIRAEQEPDKTAQQEPGPNGVQGWQLGAALGKGTWLTEELLSERQAGTTP